MGSEKMGRTTKRSPLVGVVSVVFVLAGIMVASASAEPVFLLAEWLVNGAAIPAGTTHHMDAEGS